MKLALMDSQCVTSLTAVTEELKAHDAGRFAVRIKEKVRNGMRVFLTHGTTEEELDFVSVL